LRQAIPLLYCIFDAASARAAAVAVLADHEKGQSLVRNMDVGVTAKRAVFDVLSHATILVEQTIGMAMPAFSIGKTQR
jgi:hypothetical protein